MRKRKEKLIYVLNQTRFAFIGWVVSIKDRVMGLEHRRTNKPMSSALLEEVIPNSFIRKKLSYDTLSVVH